jgi:putative transposase
MKVRRAYAKVKNSRRDFLHKTTSSMIAKYDGVVLENLNIKGMVKNHKVAKSISDVGWYEFRRQLEYKCRWRFKHFIVIDRFSPTSKTCSCCGYIQEMPMEIRIYNCPDCGMSLDRDLNASINIKRLGLNTLGRRGIKACGEPSVGGMSFIDIPRYGLTKQEKECLVN